MKLVVIAPLLVEAVAVRSGLPGVKVRRSGMGRREIDFGDADAIGVAGLCGAVEPSLRAGDVVLATELRSEDGATVSCPDSALLAEPLDRMGLRTMSGTVYTASKILGREERLALRDQRVIAVDMESAWIAAAARERPVAVLRVVVDTADRRLASLRTLLAGARGLWSLRRASAAFVDWVDLMSVDKSTDNRLYSVEQLRYAAAGNGRSSSQWPKAIDQSADGSMRSRRLWAWS